MSRISFLAYAFGGLCLLGGTTCWVDFESTVCAVGTASINKEGGIKLFHRWVAVHHKMKRPTHEYDTKHSHDLEARTTSCTTPTGAGKIGVGVVSQGTSFPPIYLCLVSLAVSSLYFISPFILPQLNVHVTNEMMHPRLVNKDVYLFTRVGSLSYFPLPCRCQLSTTAASPSVHVRILGTRQPEQAFLTDITTTIFQLL